MIRELFRSPWPLIGVVHLAPLPGSPGWEGSMAAVEDLATGDAEALLKAGFDALLVENFGDQPFLPGTVEPCTVAAMTIAVDSVMRVAFRLRPDGPASVGLNVLRNDARSALSIAAVTGAAFIRVNVHTGAMLTDQGILQGQAHETLRLKRSLGARVALFADVLVKHATPLGSADITVVARDTYLRGGADALILSGSGTGEPVDLFQAGSVRRTLPDAPLLAGSGVDLESLQATLERFDGAIVGTSVKRDGGIRSPVDPSRASALVKARDALLPRR